MNWTNANYNNPFHPFNLMRLKTEHPAKSAVYFYFIIFLYTPDTFSLSFGFYTKFSIYYGLLKL